jgi:hypothetical protein
MEAYSTMAIVRQAQTIIFVFAYAYLLILIIPQCGLTGFENSKIQAILIDLIAAAYIMICHMSFELKQTGANFISPEAGMF